MVETVTEGQSEHVGSKVTLEKSSISSSKSAWTLGVPSPNKQTAIRRIMCVVLALIASSVWCVDIAGELEPIPVTYTPYYRSHPLRYDWHYSLGVNVIIYWLVFYVNLSYPTWGESSKSSLQQQLMHQTTRTNKPVKRELDISRIGHYIKSNNNSVA